MKDERWRSICFSAIASNQSTLGDGDLLPYGLAGVEMFRYESSPRSSILLPKTAWYYHLIHSLYEYVGADNLPGDR